MTCEVCGATTGWVDGWKLQSANEAKRAAMGTGRVLAELLRDATAVLRTIDPENATEGEQLEALIDRAEKAYGEILETPNVEHNRRPQGVRVDGPVGPHPEDKG